MSNKKNNTKIMPVLCSLVKMTAALHRRQRPSSPERMQLILPSALSKPTTRIIPNVRQLNRIDCPLQLKLCNFFRPRYLQLPRPLPPLRLSLLQDPLTFSPSRLPKRCALLDFHQPFLLGLPVFHIQPTPSHPPVPTAAVVCHHSSRF